MTTAGDIREALYKRHGNATQGRENEAYICIEEARSGAGFEGNSRQCDFLAINTWQSRGMELIGYEIKVSLTDWRKELANPHKAESFARFCKTWWVAVPSDLAAKMAHEVPTNWGLLVVSEKGRCTEKQKPKVNHNPAQVPVWYWIGWLAQIDRQHKRRLPQLVEAQLKPERERMEAFYLENAERRARAQDDDTLARLAKLDAFETATGFDVAHCGRWELERLGKLLNALRRGTDLEGAANQMRKAVDLLDAMHGLRDALPDAV